ncbi:MAG: alpha-galactosidase [Armatimonadetes bacterium]|nr:alpha-galactosidase [Armatimonadota bacterium]
MAKPKIVFVGAGSHFGWTLSRDVLSRENLRGGTLALTDPHEGRLAATTAFVQKMIDEHDLPTRLESSTDRTEVLADADFVVTSIAVGGRAYTGEPFYSEVMIPKKYGVDQSVADTIGVGGIFRFLRTAPVMVDICADMERLCPNALLLNYTNPMAMLTWACAVSSPIPNVGLCHSVQGTNRELASYLGVDASQTTYRCGGINHQAWFTEYRLNGEDLYPRLRAAMDDPAIAARDSVRFEMLRYFGYFVTESTRHNSEYVPWFRKDPETMARLGLEPRTPPAAAEEGVRESLYKRYYQEDGTLKPTELGVSHEFASAIIEAGVTGQPFLFAGNVMNSGLIPNLPEGCCVEVPCVADRNGVTPTHFGELPAPCAAINRTNVNVQELAVQAFLARDRDLAFQACALDPLCAAVLPLPRIRELFDELWAAEGPLLAYFD